MLKNPIGAFYSIAKGPHGSGYLGAFRNAVADGATALHLFGKSPRSIALRGAYAAAAKEARAYFTDSPLKYAVLHAGYVLNFGKKLPPTALEFKNIIEDLHIAETLGIQGVVLHMGKFTDGDPVESKAIFVENIAHIVRETSDLKAKLILENTAGQGSEMGYTFEEYGALFKAIQKDLGKKDALRLGACLDSQHSFGAGYDWTDAKKAKAAFDLYDTHVGLENIECVHFNDSKKPCGSRRDRHEDIGVGLIGTAGLKRFIELLNKKSGKYPPLLLETPEVAAPYAEQIKEVKSWF